MAHATLPPALTEQNTLDDPKYRSPLILGGRSLGDMTDGICQVAERKPPKAWYVAMFFSLCALAVLGVSIGYLFLVGTGTWGLNNPVNWGWAIVNFVWWVGIGHAGTLISAILYLFRQKWRTGINRAAEAMTIFAVICAGMFPGLPIGRVWMAY